MSSADESDFVVLANNDLTDYNDAGYLPQDPQTLAAIQEWLAPTKYLSENSEYRKHLNSYLAGTGHWFKTSKPYREWHDRPSIGALWVKAVAGAGKSVLAASIAAKLAEIEKVPVIFFFFRQIVALNHEPKYLVRDWLSQLLPHSPWLQRTLKIYIKDQKDINTISLDELWRYICDALSFMPKVYCIVDALDEMDQDEAFLEKLIQLGRQKPASIKVLLTSRPVPRIENLLRSHVSQVRLDPKEVEDDVDMYVRYRLKPIGGPPNFYETLKPIICRRAQGLFLYARLVTDELIEAVKGIDITPSDIPKIVESVPDSLEDVYNRMLTEHSKRSGVTQNHQLTILQWVTHSTRPLRLIEAAAIMKAIGGAGETLKETKALVRAACGPLLEVLEDETLSVIHHSFTEYLTQADRKISHFPIVKKDEAHHLMAITCVSYLCNGSLEDWELKKPDMGKRKRRNACSDTRSDKEVKLKHPLLDYAISNWYKHAAKADLDNTLVITLDKFFQPETHSYRAWLELGTESEGTPSFTTVHVAAWTGLVAYTRHLIRNDVPPNEKDSNSRTPLSYAASRGHSDVVAALLELKIDANVDDDVGWRPIHHASMANHYKVVRLLLAAGVDPLTGKSREHPGRRCGNAPRTTGTTSVKYAAQAGHVETVLELVPFLKKEEPEKALHWAAKNGRAGVVAALLELPEVDIDHFDEHYEFNETSHAYTALFQATISRDPATMSVLLKRGASTTIRCFPHQRWGSPKPEKALGLSLMHAFSGKYGHTTGKVSEDSLKEAFDLLVNAGCEIDLRDDTGKTPLLYSCSRDYTGSCPSLIMMLLKAGANASAVDNDGYSVFHLYDKGGSTEVVDALIRHGADINAVIHRGPDSGTPAILNMLSNYNDEVILKFLDHKPNVNAKNKDGDTALHVNSKRSSSTTAVVDRLLELGADVNARNNLGQTPMHYFGDRISHGTRGVARLIAAGADLDAADNQGKTLLSLALHQYQPQETIKAFLAMGANINVRDLEGKSIIHLALSTPGLASISEILANSILAFANICSANIYYWQHFLKNSYFNSLLV